MTVVIGAVLLTRDDTAIAESLRSLRTEIVGVFLIALSITVLLSLVILFAVGTLIASPGRLGRPDVILIVATLALAWLFARLSVARVGWGARRDRTLTRDAV